MPAPMEFVSCVEEELTRAGFSHFGFSALERPLSMDLYREWIRDGRHAGMDYLERHADLKESPASFMPRAQTAIVVARPYFPHPYPQPYGALDFSARIALYASGEDYHFHFRRELEEVAANLRRVFVNQEFLCFTDSAPILERDLAYRAGLGWIGKNTCLIHPKKGSLFFLGQILTSVNLSSVDMEDAQTSPIPDLCGTCDRCLRACPTQALVAPRTLDANKCISYWTIEAKADASLELRTQIGDWFFGCDICQTVCPWNEKLHGKAEMQKLSVAATTLTQTPTHALRPKPERESAHAQEPVRANAESTSTDRLIDDLRWVLTSSSRQIQKRFHGLPLLRARARGLKRNALYVAGNLRLAALRPEIELAQQDPRLKEVATWALGRLA
ncbi:MAG: tRNA epoxyqueuosine(34) reductase QueG [Bdellovibrionales bacterium]